ncbi:MAG: thioredoxin family protein [Planctomycetaceae bacterium]
MKPLIIITSMLAIMCLLLAINPLHAWQADAKPGIPAEASGAAAEESNQVQTELGTLTRGGNPGPLTQAGSAPTGNTRQLSSSNVLITWSENNDELRGFSNSLGEWETLKIDKQGKIEPFVSNEVAVVRIGDSIAAFSGVKGWWDMIPLSKGSIAQPDVTNDLVAIEDNGHLYTFAATKGRWTSPTDPDLRPIREEIKADPKAVPLAEWPFEQWLETLPRYKARGIRGQFSGSGTIYLYLERKSLLEEASAAIGDALKRHERTAAAKSPPAQVTDAATGEKSIAELRAELQKLELAFNASSDTKLRRRVEEAFDLRQQLQRLEAQRMRLKLQEIEARLDARERSRANIIERRVEQLSLGKLAFTMPQTVGSESSGVQLLGFTASYCGPCQAMEPVIQRMKNDQFPVRMIDITREPDLTRTHKIDRIPTFVLIVGDKEVKRFLGVTSDSELRMAMIKAAMQLAETRAPKSDSAEARTEAKDAEQPESQLFVRDTEENNQSSDPKFTREYPLDRVSGANIQWPQPSEIAKELRRHRTFAAAKKKAQLEIDELSRPLEELKSEGILKADATEEVRLLNLRFKKDLFLKFYSSEVEELDDWNQAWSAYQSRLRLLKLDVEEAKLAFESRTTQNEQVRKKHEAGFVSVGEVQKSASELTAARFNLLRAEELLKLYADIETQEPDLNPDSFKPEK